jgi:hypothetical protein
MNLENLKSEWSAMNHRMEKREILEEKMFCEMLNTKSDKSLNRLMLYEVINLIGCVLTIPFLLFISYQERYEYAHPIIIGVIVGLIIGVFWYGFKVLVLSKIDFSKSLKNNLLNVNKYAIYIKYEKLFIYYILIPLLMIVITFFYVKLHAHLLAWIFASCIGLAVIFFTIYLYRLYNKNISTIQQNLEELRELEDK